MTYKTLLAGALALLFVATLPLAQAQTLDGEPIIDITDPNFQPVPIAIANFVAPPGLAQRADDIRAVVEADLLAALDLCRPGHAVLDVFREEPLPAGHPFWRHPKVTVTPHVSGWHVDGMAETIAANYRRLVAGEALLHEVDRQTGY